MVGAIQSKRRKVLIKATIMWLCLSVAGAEAETKVVYTLQGPVRGYKDPDLGIFAFQSIPYANAPTGENKYHGPLPAPTWQEPFDAVDKGIVCHQNPIATAGKNVQEDCLIVNVYVPATEQNNMPVIVRLHGGAFQILWGDQYIPKPLVSEHSVILVNCNYRLGIPGFLNLRTEDIPGNAGLKDQVACLRWVKNNIAGFGGDPGSVTVSGYSAGAACADLMIFSKLARGLFHRVIPESGVSTSVFTIQMDPLGNAKKIAKSNNVSDVDDIKALEHFFKTASYEILTKDAFLSEKDLTFVMSPSIERDSKDAFLTEHPLEMLKKGTYTKVPVLHGFSSLEGYLQVINFDSWKSSMNTRFSDYLPANLIFKNDADKEDAANKTKTFYFGDNAVDNNSILQFCEYFSAPMFTYPVLLLVKLLVESGHKEVYMYEYTFIDKNTPVTPYTNQPAVGHGSQTFALMGVSPIQPDPTKLTPEYIALSKAMRTYWANFIKTGKPTDSSSELPAWPPAGADGAPHMILDRDLALGGPLLRETFSLWDGIYKEHRRVPMPADPQNSGCLPNKIKKCLRSLLNLS